MIGFLQPLALLALVAAAGPVLLHLLQRRDPPVVPFPAVQYLQEAARQHRHRLRLRHLLLLLLRTAAILFIVLAAARPVVRVPVAGGHAPLALALVVDHGLSSGAIAGGARVLDTLVARAGRVLAGMNGDDRLWLVLADGVPRRVGRPEARRALATLEPAPVRVDLGAAVRAAARAVAEDPLPGQVVVLSDNQATAWSAGEAAAPVLLWPVRAPRQNRGVDSVRLLPPIWPGEGRVLAAIGGRGGATPVTLDAAGRVVARALASPGEVVELAGSLPPGWHAARVTLDGDELLADDVRHVAIRSAPPAAVRVGPGAGPFVAAAVQVLAEAGRLAPGGAPGTGAAVTIGERLGPGVRVLVPPADPALVGSLNRALAARGLTWHFGPAGAPGAPSSVLADLTGVTVRRRHVLTGGTGPAIATVEGSPWIVREGDVVLLGSRLDEAWTDLPAHVAFVPFLDALLNQVAAANAWVVDVAPGAVISLPAGDVVVHGPAGSIPVGADARLTAPLAPGVYLAVRGTDTLGAVTVNADPRETPLAPASVGGVRGALGRDVRLVRGAGAADAVFARTAARADLSAVLLLLALATVIAEFLLAARGGRVGGETA